MAAHLKKSSVHRLRNTGLYMTGQTLKVLIDHILSKKRKTDTCTVPSFAIMQFLNNKYYKIQKIYLKFVYQIVDQKLIAWKINEKVSFKSGEKMTANNYREGNITCVLHFPRQMGHSNNSWHTILKMILMLLRVLHTCIGHTRKGEERNMGVRRLFSRGGEKFSGGGGGGARTYFVPKKQRNR